MLKIKDNIPLKELEKFGFEKTGDFYRCPFECVYMSEIIVDEPTRKIEIDGEVGYYEADKYNDILYDLIKADMVEKVEN
jgi:hypothetical protein